MADEILKKARDALIRSQQFRIQPAERTITRTQEQIVPSVESNRESTKYKVEPQRGRRHMNGKPFQFPEESGISTSRKKISFEDDSSTASSVSFTLSTEDDSKFGKKLQLQKQALSPLDGRKTFHLGKSDQVAESKTDNFEKTTAKLNLTTSKNESISSVKSLLESVQEELSSERTLVRGLVSSEEISKKPTYESDFIEETVKSTETQDDKNKHEGTLSPVSSLKVSPPHTETEDDDTSYQEIGSFPKSTSLKTISKSQSELNKSSPVPEFGLESIGDKLSERIESIAQELASVQEILQQSNNYSSNFLSEVSSRKASDKVETADDTDKYDSSFSEDEVKKSTHVKPLSENKSNEKCVPENLIIGDKNKSEDKVPVPPKIKKTKSKKTKKTKETDSRIEYEELYQKFVKDYPEFEYKPEAMRKKTQPDYSNPVMISDAGDLQGFCRDLIRNVVDSNERMYKYTMEAAESMSRMYHRRRKNERTSNGRKFEQIY